MCIRDRRKLEPVAAGDAVAGPVVEIFVGDDAIDVLEIDVGGDIGARQHIPVSYTHLTLPTSDLV